MKKTRDPKKFPNGTPPLNKFIWDYRLEILSGLLMLVGIVLSFYYLHTGGAFVGLGVGICFFAEIHNYFLQLRSSYVEKGIFKTLMLIGVVVYFLISIPAFVIAVCVGYGILYFIQRALRRP